MALEQDPDTGLLVHREVVLTVPRQSGKTFLLLAVMVHRALGFGQRQRILYTAQTRNDARRKWEDEHVATLEASSMRKLFVVRKSNGAEAIRWKNGSMHGITSTTEKAGHGETLDLGVIDEAFAHEDNRLEQGLRPTMITRPEPQLWVVSTAGSRRSNYLRSKVDAGRMQSQVDVPSATAYFEWSAPDDADPTDPTVWRACMPALGHTVREGAISAEMQSMQLTEFRRAYLNQWPDAAPEGWLVIPRASWRELVDARSKPGNSVAFAVDVTPDRTYSSIAVSGRRADGKLHIELVDYGPGTHWVVQRVAELCDRWSPRAIAVDPGGPAGSLIESLENADVEVTKPSVRDATHAAQAFYDGVMDSQHIRHLDQPQLNSALAGAMQRSLGDAWLWARKGLSVDISPLVAVTLAAWAYEAADYEEDYNVLESVW